jgi:hypothetical protein
MSEEAVWASMAQVGGVWASMGAGLGAVRDGRDACGLVAGSGAAGSDEDGLDDELDDIDSDDLDDEEDDEDDDDLDEFDDDELDDDEDDDEADEIDFTEDRYERIPGEDDADV